MLAASFAAATYARSGNLWGCDLELGRAVALPMRVPFGVDSRLAWVSG